MRQRFPQACFIRQEKNLGYIEGRNILMRHSSADYFVHLDDDAGWPRDDAVVEAVRVMQTDPDCGIFSFKVHEAVEPPPDPKPAQNIHPVRTFTGCGHIIARWTFEKLGPLRSEYYFYCEETEYCLRALEAGIKTLRDDGLIVHHRVDWQVRDRLREESQSAASGQTGKDWRVRIATRNELWWISELVPWPVLPFFLVRKFIRLLQFHAPKGFARMVFSGGAEWIGLLRHGKIRRRPVSLRTFRMWLALRP